MTVNSSKQTVFTGRLRDNKEKGIDKSTRRLAIDAQDMEKLFKNYFMQAVTGTNTKVLLHKVFFDIVYYTGRRGKEGLRDLNKNSFAIKKGTDGLDYIELTFNEKTKRNQGHKNSSAQSALHNDHHIISEQPDDILCPVRSFKKYMALLHDDTDVFFQYPSKNDKYDRKPIGKNTLATMMKEISEDAGLSRIYMNHCKRKTTATGLKRQGFELHEIQNVTKHKNLDSLKHHISGPTYQEKQNYNQALLKYGQNEINKDETCQNKRHKKTKNVPKQQTPQPAMDAQTPIMPEKPDISPENCLIPMLSDQEDTNDENLVPAVTTQQSNVVNQMRQASHMFQNASFTNCNFTFQMPK